MMTFTQVEESRTVQNATRQKHAEEPKGHEEASIAQLNKDRDLVTRPNDRLEPLLLGTVLFGGAQSVRPCGRPDCIHLGSPTMRKAHYQDLRKHGRQSRPEALLCLMGSPTEQEAR